MRKSCTMNTNMLHNYLKLSAVGVVLTTPVFAQGGGYASGDLASRERIRRESLINEADSHLYSGRDAYIAGDYEKAVSEYRAALDKTPKGAATKDRRDEMVAHLSDGSVALAQQYRKEGKYDEARQLLDSALAEDPNNAAAQRQVEYLADPIRTNPALTAEHTENVDQVTRLLYLGEGYYNLGDFDKAEAEFNNVLKIDRYNKAARRWLERVASIKSDYYRSAYDQTRAKLLMEVDKAWELSVAPDIEVAELIGGGGSSETNSRQQSITSKLKNIIIPVVDFEDVSVEEAISELRQRSRELDNTELDLNKKGVNFIIRAAKSSSTDNDLGDEESFGSADPSVARISELKLRNVPLIQVLQFICDLAQLRYRVDEYAVTLLPVGSEETGDLLSRTWKVTPTFIADLGGAASGGDGGGSDDPFAFSSDDDSGGGFSKASVTDLLANSGVEFNDGATANFLPATSTLIVRNTINNLDLVDSIVTSINSKTPKQIKILTKFVEVSQDNTDEIGFDWALGVPGTGFTLNGGTTGNGQAVNDFSNFSSDATGVITSGLRSGGSAVTSDSITSLLLSDSTSADTSTSAPGVLSVGGILNGNTVEMIFRGLSQKRGVDVMNAPSIVARSGETAKIEVIREFIYPSEYEPPELPQTLNSSSGVFPITPSTPTAFETRNTGVTLEILPTIGETNDYVIDLQFAPEIVEFEGFINYGSPISGLDPDSGGSITITENRIDMPVFSTRRVTTSLTIYDGHTVAVGGLLSENVQNVEDKVPILGDLPLVGRLFQSKAESRIKSNLIIFVTAQVIDATGTPIRGVNSTSGSDLDAILSDGGGLLPPPVN